jgi:Uma2 family endonuclease
MLGTEEVGMTSLELPVHPLTLAEWEVIPESDQYRLEVAEGMAHMVAKPFGRHQKAMSRLDAVLTDALPRELISLPDVDVLLEEGPLTVRAPDLVVVPTTVYEQDLPRYAGADVALVVEILSEGTRRADRVTKFAEYAEFGIPQYWIIDLASPTVLTAFVLVDGVYELAGECRGSAALTVAGHPVEVDLEALTAR